MRAVWMSDGCVWSNCFTCLECELYSTNFRCGFQESGQPIHGPAFWLDSWRAWLRILQDQKALVSCIGCTKQCHDILARVLGRFALTKRYLRDKTEIDTRTFLTMPLTKSHYSVHFSMKQTRPSGKYNLDHFFLLSDMNAAFPLLLPYSVGLRSRLVSTVSWKAHLCHRAGLETNGKIETPRFVFRFASDVHLSEPTAHFLFTRQSQYQENGLGLCGLCSTLCHSVLVTFWWMS